MPQCLGNDIDPARRELNLVASAKVHVNASMRKVMSFAWMLKTEARLEMEIRELLRKTV